MVDELEPGRPWSHKFQWNMGFQWTFMSSYEWLVFQVWIFHFLSWKFQLQGTFVTGFFISRKQSFTMSICEHHQQKGWTHTRKPLFGVSRRLMSSIHHEACRTNTTQKHEVCAISSFTANLETNTKKHKKQPPKTFPPKKAWQKKTASTPHQTKIPFILTQLNILLGRLQKTNFPSLCSDLLRHPRHFFATIEAQR